jgi:hypothetical protein
MRSFRDVLYNFHWVLDGEIARSAQAYAGFLGSFLRAHGIRSVLNLRGPNPAFCWWHYEKRVTEKLGIEHIDLPLNSRKLVIRVQLLKMMQVFESAPKPMLIKCSGGQDRTSFACALYLIHRKGWQAYDEAEKQFSRWPYLHFPKMHQRWLRQFLNYACEQCAGAPLQDWVEQSYTPEHFREWLQARGMGDYFRGLHGKPPRGL